MAQLAPDMTGEVTRVVTDDLTAHAMDNAGVRVLATPILVMLIEQAAIRAIESALGEGQSSVGTHVDIRHLAATPVGMTVTTRARLVAVDGRKLTYEVEAEDEQEPVARGTHERFVGDTARFLARVAEKAGKGASPSR